MRTLLIGWLVLVTGASCFAELKLATVFSDGMVLQRDQAVPVWGWTDAGAKVTVEFGGQKKMVDANGSGKWQVMLDPMTASAKSQTLTVSQGSSDKLHVSNVLIGEVWLCSGQSNMQMAVEKAQHFEAEKAAADYPQIRMFLTALKADAELLEDCKGEWKVCSPETVGTFSATGYFFGRKLHQELNVPIGLVRSCWGGTRIESWSPMASLEKYPSVMEYKASEDAKVATFGQAASEARYAKQLADWKVKAKAAKEDGKKTPKRPKQQIHPHTSQNYPANLYNAMINPLIPYGIRGAIWYQGEANTKSQEQALLYRELLENLTVQWRKDWGADFPFYAVQLVNYRKPVTVPVQDTGWALIRDSFLKYHKEVPNAGIAIGIDVGMENDIHPINKQAIGLRLAHQALANTYKLDVVAGGPIYQSVKIKGSKIIVSFSDLGSGLMAKDGALKTFAIAGADKQFIAAKAEIVGDTVVVSSPDVADPKSVRYAWVDNPVGCNLYNKEGFPASPFRTDEWAPVPVKK